MSKKIHKLSSKIFLLLAFALVATLTFWGCSSDSYDEADTTTQNAPLAGQTENVLIDKATLESWRSLVNNDETFEKVVILDATEAGSYLAGHIPGAQLWDVSEQVMTRTEGPIPAVNMVLDGASMDAMLQKHGIDDGTTIVITSGSPKIYYPARAYFLFRYWGWPKEKIKVLQGLNNAYDASELTSAAPVIAASDFSVQDIGNFCPDERVSVAELINAVADGVGVPVDCRGNKSAAGSTTGVYSDEVSGDDYVVFEGTIKGGKYFSYTNFMGSDLRFRNAADIEADLEAAGITGISKDGSNTNPVYSYCRTAYIASAGYFVVDGILGWDVMTYDGSWSQWGKLAAIETDANADGSDDNTGAELPQGSLWDVTDLMEVINYNQENGFSVETADLDSQAHALYPDPYQLDANGNPVANQIENEDADYITSGGAADGVSGGGGGGC